MIRNTWAKQNHSKRTSYRPTDMMILFACLDCEKEGGAERITSEGLFLSDTGVGI